jgi:hypothetical protein
VYLLFGFARIVYDKRMAHAPTVPLVVDDEGIWLVFAARFDPTARLAWDRDAIVTHVLVRASVFEGMFTTLIWSHELVILYHQFMDLWQHVGHISDHQFIVREQTLNFTTALLRSGHVQLSFELRPDPATDTILRFSVVAEHMALTRWLHALYETLRAFPAQIPSQMIPVPPQVEP